MLKQLGVHSAEEYEVWDVMSYLLQSAIQAAALVAYRDIAFSCVNRSNLGWTSPSSAVLVLGLEPYVHKLIRLELLEFYCWTCSASTDSFQSLLGKRLYHVATRNLSDPCVISQHCPSSQLLVVYCA